MPTKEVIQPPASQSEDDDSTEENTSGSTLFEEKQVKKRRKITPTTTRWKVIDGLLKHLIAEIDLLSNDIYSTGYANSQAIKAIYADFVEGTKHPDFKFPKAGGGFKKPPMRTGIPKSISSPESDPFFSNLFQDYIKRRKEFIIEKIQEEIDFKKKDLGSSLSLQTSQNNNSEIIDDEEDSSESEDDNIMHVSISDLKRNKPILTPEKQTCKVKEIESFKKRSKGNLQPTKNKKQKFNNPETDSQDIILNESVDLLLDKMCDLVESDVNKLDVTMRESTEFLSILRKAIKHKAGNIEEEIKSIEEEKQKVMQVFESRIQHLNNTKQEVVGPLLELEGNCSILLAKNMEYCKEAAQKASSRIKDRFNQQFIPPKREKCNLSEWLKKINKALNCPKWIFVSPTNGEVYIADAYNHRVRKILLNGNIVTIAGNGEEGYSGDNGPAISAQLCNPSSVFVSNNEVFIADTYNNVIRKILTNGNIVTIAGNGEEGYSGDNGPAINAQLCNPKSVFVSNNEVYFADQGNNRIRKIQRNGNIVTIAGNGQGGYSGDNDIATDAQLSKPQSVFVSNYEVYIADFGNHRIRKILTNGIIVTIAGNGHCGYSDEDIATNSMLCYPQNVFVSNNTLYITDQGNNRIRKVLENGNIVTIAGNGEEGYSGDSTFDFSTHPHIG